MQIIEASIEDIWIIQALSNQIWPHTFRDILTEEQMRYMMNMMYSSHALEDQMEKHGHHYLLIKDGDEYIGYTSYEIGYKSSELTKIHKIYVLPSTQGKGIGRKLIAEIETIARKCNDKGLILNVNRYNPAIEFYKLQGFDIVGEEDIDIGNGFLMEDYIMQKIL